MNSTRHSVNGMRKIKTRVYEIIQTAESGDKASRTFDISIICLIMLNVALIIADTFMLPENISTIFSYVEAVSVIVFTLEYVLRIWTSDILYPNRKPVSARLRYVISPMAIIDFLSILPFYFPYVFPIGLRVLRVLRVTRLLRIFKVNRYTDALNVIGKVIRSKGNQLLSSILVVFLLMIIASVLMFNVENAAQPNEFSNAFDALWWAVATLTTVGYGDVFPITILGKILSAVIALLGIGLVAVPTGIISAGFVEQIDEKKHEGENDNRPYCPYCGKKIL